MEKRHINRKRCLAAAIAAAALTGLGSQANADLSLKLVQSGTGYNGTTTINGATLNTALTLDVWAGVTGADASSANDGLQIAEMAFNATGSAGTVSGSTAPIAPWNGNGTSAGVANGSNWGGTDVNDPATWWTAISSSVQSGTGAASDGSGHFKLGSITFTPTASGAATVTPALRPQTAGALWFEDATITTPASGPAIWSNDHNASETAKITVAGVTVNAGGAVGTNTWITDGSGVWSAAANWDASSIPTAGATVNFGVTSPNNNDKVVTVDGGGRTVGGINFDNAAHAYTLAGTDTLTINANSNLNVVSGNHAITAPVAYLGNVTKQGAGGLTVPNVVTTGTLSVTGGQLVVAANDGTAAGRTAHSSKVAGLTVSGGSVDLKNNTMVVQNTAAGNGGSALTGIGGMIRSGQIVTTGVAPAGKSTALGYAQGNDANLGITSPIAGQSYAAADTIIKFTYKGDANLDGSVDGVDISKWAQNFTGSGPAFTKAWTQGDWNYDGAVDGVDAGLWASNFTGSGGGILAAPLGGGVSAVPEPASLGLLAVSGLALVRRRRK